jgi:hypothetical protein
MYVPKKGKSKNNFGKKLIFCWHLVSHSQNKLDPDQYQNFIDSNHNTGSKIRKVPILETREKWEGECSLVHWDIQKETTQTSAKKS